MRVLFYQPNYTGHYFAYLARMLPGFVDLPIEILLATTAEAIASEEFSKSLAPFGDRLQLVPCCTPPPRGSWGNFRHRLRELVGSIRTTRPDHAVACYADGIWELAYASTLIGRRPWARELIVEGCLYRGRFEDRGDRRWRSRLRRRMLVGTLRQGLFRRLHVHHELLFDFAHAESRGTPTSVVLAPDPIVIRPPMSTSEGRRELGVGGEGLWIGMAGVLARYKGAHLFLEAYRLRRARGDVPPVRALMAGPLRDDIRSILQAEPYRGWVADGSVVLVDRHLTEQEMYAAAAAVDLVVAPYPNHQNRSSILLWAAAAGRPCIVPMNGCANYVLRRERLGVSCQVENPEILADTISATLGQPWTAEDALRARTYAEFHRMENYQAISSSLVRERLGVVEPSAAPVEVVV